MLKLIRHLRPSMKTELYNLAEVISESTSIAFNGAYKTLKRHMLSLKMTGPSLGRDREAEF